MPTVTENSNVHLDTVLLPTVAYSKVVNVEIPLIVIR